MERKEELLKKLLSENKEEVREAIESLEEFTGEDIVRRVLDALIAHRSKVILEAGRSFLISYRGGEEICREVIKLFEYPEPKLRQMAIEVLANRGNTCLEIIESTLIRHHDYNMRKFAVDILSLINTEESLKKLEILLRDKNPNVSMSALEGFKNFTCCTEMVIKLLKDTISSVEGLYGITTLASTIIYGDIRDNSLRELLKDKLRSLQDPMEKHWIYKALVFLGEETVHQEALENAKTIGMEEDILKDIEIFGQRD